jgi:hypothetical protein
VTRSGVLWRMQRGDDRYEAVISEREPGTAELIFLENGSRLKSLWLAAGQGLAALEEALARRANLKATGWTESTNY